MDLTPRELKKLQQAEERDRQEREKLRRKAVRDAKMPSSTSASGTKPKAAAKPAKAAARKPANAPKKRKKVSSSSEEEEEDDEEDEEDESEEKVASGIPDDSSALPPPAQFSIDAAVEATCPSDESWMGKYFRGVVSAVNADGTYDVSFSDGDFRDHLPAACVRPQPLSERERKKAADMEALFAKLAGEPVPEVKEKPMKAAKKPAAKKKKKPLPTQKKQPVQEMPEDSDEEDLLMALKRKQPAAPAAQSVWVTCDKCDKWRRWVSAHPPPGEDDQWECSQNEDARHNRCQAHQELTDKEIDLEIAAHDPATNGKREPSCSERKKLKKERKKERKEKRARSEKLLQPKAQKVMLSSEEDSDNEVLRAPKKSSLAAEPKGKEVEHPKRVHPGSEDKPRDLRSGELVIFNICLKANLADVRLLASRFGRVQSFKAGACTGQGYQLASVVFADHRDANNAAENLSKLSINRMGLRCFRRFKTIKA